MADSVELDLSSFNDAINQLEQALAYCDTDLARSDPKLYRLLRTAAIQTFEFTYELSWKMLKRYLESASGSPQTVEQMTFQDLIRTGNEQALLLSDWPAWKDFRHARTITSHVYNQKKADEVFAIIPRFGKEARFLLKSLQDRASAR